MDSAPWNRSSSNASTFRSSCVFCSGVRCVAKALQDSSLNSRFTVAGASSPKSTMPPGSAHSPVSLRWTTTTSKCPVSSFLRVTIGSAAVQQRVGLCRSPSKGKALGFEQL